MTTKHIPSLPTLTMNPSWLNAAGNVDRSACVEVKVSEVRRLAGCVINGWRKGTKWVQERNGPSLIWGRVGTEPLPHEKRVRTGQGRQATGILHLDIHDVERLLHVRPPRRLAGDWRTGRAPAMRPTYFQREADSRGVLRFPTRFRGKPQGAGTSLESLDEGLTGNPNRGASRQKVLTLDDRWQQPLRIEEWRQRNSILPFYYLVCPGPRWWWRVEGHAEAQAMASTQGGVGGVGGAAGAAGVGGAGGVVACDEAPMFPPVVTWQGEKDSRCPALSTAPLGAKAKGCPQRVLFLMMPLATREELADAATAQAWIASLPAPERRRERETVQYLMNRYGLLFEPRCFVCRRCLGVRYGADTEKERLRRQRK